MSNHYDMFMRILFKISIISLMLLFLLLIYIYATIGPVLRDPNIEEATKPASQQMDDFANVSCKEKTPSDILRGRDLSSQYFIVTGANSGLGFITAKALALHNGHVVLACRNMISCEARKRQIMAEKSSASVETMFLDLASLASVRQFAHQYIQTKRPLHVLILNAGVVNTYHSTEDHLDVTFQVNYFGHFYLTLLLRDVILSTPRSRVVHLSSDLHRSVERLSSHESGRLRIDDLSLPPETHNFVNAYAIAKLCNILFSKELQRRWEDHPGFLSVALTPGNLIATNIERNVKKWSPFSEKEYAEAKTPEQGATTIVYSSIVNDGGMQRGRYYEDCVDKTPSTLAEDRRLAAELWDISERTLRQRGFST